MKTASFLVVLLLAGCSGDDDGGDRDAGDSDGGMIRIDSGPGIDAGPGGEDAGPTVEDSGPRDMDAGPPDSGPEADTGPRPDAGPPPAADDVTRAGVIWGSCVPDDGITDFIQELWDGAPDIATLPSVLACIASAGGGCAALETCAGIIVDASGPCLPECVGTTFSACDDRLHLRVDCARLGLTCTPEEGCTDGPPTSCEFDTFVERCEGGRPVYCGGIVHRGPVCADTGTRCTVAGGEAACVGTGGACAGEVFSPGEVSWEGGISCDGTVLTACVNGGLATRDCATVGPGFACHTNATRSFCGLANECDPYDFSRRAACMGDSVRFCNMGRNELLDCTTLGFTTCTPGVGCTPTGF